MTLETAASAQFAGSRSTDGGEPTRARYPDEEGYVERDGVRLFYEVYGDGEPTLLFMPSWSIAPSRSWKPQLPYFGRHFRALTFDGRGAGRSDRPPGVAPYEIEEFVEDAIAVMDATVTQRAFVIGQSLGAAFSAWLAAYHPERVSGLACIAPLAPSGRPSLHDVPLSLFRMPLPVHPGWAKFNRHYMRRHQREFLQWFVPKLVDVPHSTRQIEDGLEWGLEIDADILSRTAAAFVRPGLLLKVRKLTRAIECPVLVVHAEEDPINPPHDGRMLAKRTGGRYVSLPGSAHALAGREPVAINLALREFVEAEHAKLDA